MTKQSKATKLIDRRIEIAYRAKCCGIQIDIMDIDKVFVHGRALLAAGATDQQLADGIHEYVTTNLARK